MLAPYDPDIAQQSSSITKISELLYIGNVCSRHSQPSPYIHSCITILGQNECDEVEEQGAPSWCEHYLRLYWEDTGIETTSHLMDGVYQAIRFAREHCKAGILVHCHMGISRSATILLAIMMWEYSSTFDECYAFVKEKRQMVNPNMQYVALLRVLEKNLMQENMEKKIHTHTIHHNDI